MLLYLIVLSSDHNIKVYASPIVKDTILCSMMFLRVVTFQDYRQFHVSVDILGTLGNIPL